ncbi:MAG TPA: radical SAM protein, partial [Myxococcales bacterium]
MKIVRARAERFGGIVEIERPRALLHVDREMMRELGYAESALWGDQVALEAPLTAPTEVHVVLSRRCAAGCKGCYVDATPDGAALPFADACRILDELAAMGVFHVALGGGEALELDYLFAVARHARKAGITPNLTTSGLGLDEAAAKECAVFGQINVSVDGVGKAYEQARGFDGFRHAERALRLLRAVKEEVGVNCVVSRTSYDHVAEVAALVKKLRLNELELLRFKP